MDVDVISFPSRLLRLLVNISEADFVSFDLELSGIPSHLPGQPRALGFERKTLEDRYAETKAAAERYQILQVGITCARFDYLANKYVLRPYNIALSPLLKERLDIERECSFQTGALTFLLSNDFDIGFSLSQGVQYLSREEAAKAKQMAYDRLDKKTVVEDLYLKEEDVESVDFMNRARKAINTWKTGTLPALEITTHTGLSEQPPIPVISRFEKRLVHQLIRAEFPDLTAYGLAHCIRVIHFDAGREAENTKRNKRRVKEQIARQTGFRYVFEALAQGDVQGADPFFGSLISIDRPDAKDRFDRAAERLKKHQPVLVGHNMFTDLVYFFQTFVGKLPETLGEFRKELHELFPRIVDTKWLATHSGGDLNASPSLQEIAEELKDQELPDIMVHADHFKYNGRQAYHEAGYDSLHTATIMLRLAALLGVEYEDTDSLSEQSFHSAMSTLDISIDDQENIEAPDPSPSIQEPGRTPTLDAWMDNREKPENLTPTSSIQDREQVPVEPPLPKRKQRSKGKRKSNGKNSRFHTKNIFDSLRGDGDTDEDEKSPTSAHEAAESTAQTNWRDEPPYMPDTSTWAPIQTIKRRPMELIPPFDAPFWRHFGNTLRVFGTREAVLKIAEWPET